MGQRRKKKPHARPSVRTPPRTRPRTRARDMDSKAERRKEHGRKQTATDLAQPALATPPPPANAPDGNRPPASTQPEAAALTSPNLRLKPEFINPRKERPEPEKLTAFLDGIRVGMTNMEACLFAGVTWGQVSYLQCTDKEFYRLYLEAEAQGIHADRMAVRDVLKMRAIRGWDEPVFNKLGDQVGHKERFSERATTMMAHKTAPGEYRPLPANTVPPAGAGSSIDDLVLAAEAAENGGQPEPARPPTAETKEQGKP